MINKKGLTVSLLIIAIFSINLALVSAQENKVVLVDFYGEGCPHCSALAEFLDELDLDYLQVEKYEIYSDQDNRELFQKMAAAYNTEIEGVPMVFIDDKVFVGFNDAIGEDIKKEIERCYEEECENPLDKISDSSNITEKLTIPAVVFAALADAVNPCAFAVLIILLTTVLASGSKKKALFAGLAFSLSIFIAYFLMGVGLFSAIRATGITHWFFVVVATLAILIGLFNLKDYLWYGKWFKMEVPMKWRPRMKILLKGVTSIWGAFLIGFVISLFLLPCTSGPYIAILSLLSKVATRDYAILLLLLYNLIFILPMLIITVGISFGFTTTKKTEEWRQKKLKVLHLIAGIIILLIGIGMIIALLTGAI